MEKRKLDWPLFKEIAAELAEKQLQREAATEIDTT